MKNFFSGYGGSGDHLLHFVQGSNHSN